MSKIKTAVITGQHAFDVPGFHALFRSIPDIDFYLQDLENFAADAGKVREQYEVLVFYNFHRQMPDEGRVREAIEQLGENQAGILVLHHAILAFPQWPLWSDLCGIQDRSFGFKVDQNLHVDIVDSQHPILRGLAPWEMVDETYIMADPGDDSDLLLTTDHPESMKTLAWTRQYKNARVFCCQSGHDNQVFADPNFRTVIARGIQWLAGRI